MTFKDPEDEEFERIEREQAQKVEPYSGFTYNVPKNSISFYTIKAPPEPVLIIGVDGQITWRGKIVEGDEEFKRAMIDLAGYFNSSTAPVRPRRLSREEVTLVWTTRFPPDGTINSDTFVYEFADALQTYLGIGD